MNRNKLGQFIGEKPIYRKCNICNTRFKTFAGRTNWAGYTNGCALTKYE